MESSYPSMTSINHPILPFITYLINYLKDKHLRNLNVDEITVCDQIKELDFNNKKNLSLNGRRHWDSDINELEIRSDRILEKSTGK